MVFDPAQNVARNDAVTLPVMGGRGAEVEGEAKRGVLPFSAKTVGDRAWESDEGAPLNGEFGAMDDLEAVTPKIEEELVVS